MSLSAVQEAIKPSHYQIIFAEEHVTDCALVTLIEVYKQQYVHHKQCVSVFRYYITLPL